MVRSRYVPMFVYRAVICFVATLVFVVSHASAQTKAGVADAPGANSDAGYVPTLKFDVASIRESPLADSYMVGASFSPGSSSLRISNFDVSNLLAMAYGIRFDQMVGLPLWRTMFNVEAKADGAADQTLSKLNKNQVELEREHMLQELLAERFQLKAHWETRIGLGYNLVIAKGGLKMQSAKNEPPSAEELKSFGGGKIPRLYQRGSGNVGFDYVAHGASMDDLREVLSGQFSHPVIDKTGLTGTYDFVLRYHGARLSDRNADDLDPVPTLDIALEQQLGLKVEATKAPVQMLVIDHIEKPSPN